MKDCGSQGQQDLQAKVKQWPGCPYERDVALTIWMWTRELWGSLPLLPWLHGLTFPLQHPDLNDAICLIFYIQCLSGKCFNETFLIYWSVEPILGKPWKTWIKIQIEFLKNVSLHIPKKDKLFLTCPHNFSSWQTSSQYTLAITNIGKPKKQKNLQHFMSNSYVPKIISDDKIWVDCFKFTSMCFNFIVHFLHPILFWAS